MKRYIVFPRPIISKKDKQKHYITANQLIKLYKVDPNDCYILSSRDKMKGLHGIFMPLYPKEDGKYILNNGLIKNIMKLISNFKDYYDGVQSYGHDESLLYVREERVFKANIKSINFPSLDYYQNKDFAKIEFIKVCLVGFCGQFYKGYKIRAYKKKTDVALGKYIIDVLYNQQELDFYHVHQDSYFWNKDKKLFEIENREYLHELFFKYKTPCYVITHPERTQGDKDKLVINPQLKNYKFFKIKDSFTAYQEISMFIGGTLAVPFKPIFEISDKDKIQSHGFDKWSFKKLPTKRRK